MSHKNQTYRDETKRSYRKAIRALLIYGSATGCLLATLTWLMGAIWRGREAALSAQCAGNLAQLGLALRNYDSAYGCLPPAYVVDRSGKPLYSWRVVLMAYLEREEGWNDRQLTERFRFDESWDSPANSMLHAMRPPNFFCPGFPESAQKGYTSFVAVVGPRTLFPSHGRTRRLADIRDDPMSTLMIVESINTSIHWMEPRDLEWDRMSFLVNDPSRSSISSEHRVGAHRGPHALAADGGLAYLDDSMSPAFIRALLAIDDGVTAVLHRGPRKE